MARLIRAILTDRIRPGDVMVIRHEGSKATNSSCMRIIDTIIAPAIVRDLPAKPM